jgi:hypothetical protein
MPTLTCGTENSVLSKKAETEYSMLNEFLICVRNYKKNEDVRA